MSVRAPNRLSAPLLALGFLITMVVGLGVLSAYPLLTSFALYSSLAFAAYAWFVRRPLTAVDLIFWSLPGAVAANVLTLSTQVSLARGPDPTMEAIGAGVVYGAMVGACVAFWSILVPRWSASVAKWTVGSVMAFALVGFISVPTFSCGGKHKAYMSAMKSDLRNLATAQEAHYADHGRYAAGVGDIENFDASTGVYLQVLAVSDSGWFGAAAHDRVEAMCRIFIGTGVPQNGKEGLPRCVEPD